MANDITGNTNLEKIEFYEVHEAPWNTNATDIGLTTIQVGQITTLATAARAAYNATLAARAASKSATQAYYDAVAEMARYGSSLITTIRAKAENTDDPTVYTKAQIPPKAPPTPAGPPTDCTNLGALILNDGSVMLTWTGTVKNGQFFSVKRQDFGSDTWLNLGSVRAKTFVDGTVSQGTKSAVYQVFAHRGDQVSSGCEPITVLFGAVGLAA